MFNYNSELLYLSVSSPALVSLHRTWKKVEQRRNSWKGVEEEEEEEEGEGETRRWRRRWRHWWHKVRRIGGGACAPSRLVQATTTGASFTFPDPSLLACVLACLLPLPPHQLRVGKPSSADWSLRPFYLQDMLLKVLDPETIS